MQYRNFWTTTKRNCLPITTWFLTDKYDYFVHVMINTKNVSSDNATWMTSNEASSPCTHDPGFALLVGRYNWKSW